MSDYLVLPEWISQGIPNDEHFISGAIIVDSSLLPPLVVDPQKHAVTWLLKYIPDVQTLRYTDTNFVDKVKQFLTEGGNLLIDGVGEYIDPSLHNYLNSNFTYVDGVKHVSVSGDVVPVSANFRLFIATELTSPKFPPEFLASISFVDFCPTRSSIREHLLSVLLKFEHQETEKERLQVFESRSLTIKNICQAQTDFLAALNQPDLDLFAQDNVYIQISQIQKYIN
jgi:dynein heavy chain